MALQNKVIIPILIMVTVFNLTCFAANILCIFPTASFSHQQPLLALSRALADKGHNLTVITPNPSKIPIKNHRDIDVSFLYPEVRGDHFEKNTGFSTQKRSTGFDVIKIIPSVVEFMMSTIYNSSQIQNLIRELDGIKYDLIIFEELLANSLLGFADLTGNPPIIGVTTIHLMVAGGNVGNPIIPSYIPPVFASISDHMSLWDRFLSLCYEVYFAYIAKFEIYHIQERYMHENFKNLHRKLIDLEKNQSLTIVSSDLATGYPKPLQPNTIHVGPMHIKEKLEPIPEEVRKWMDDSEEGVIYFSLGSNMKSTSIPQHILSAFIESFKKFPKIRVLWKWETDERIPGQSDNILGKKWLPQQSILAHPKVRLFLSQVGLQSFEEATYYGVPMLGVPMFGDQDFNAKKLVTAGAGLSLEFQTITYDKLYEKLKDLLTNNSYKENMLRLSSITRDTPRSPVDTAVWWVEYVLRHNGAPHLRPAVIDLSWYQYYMLDILSLIFIFGSIILYLIYFIVKHVTRLLSLLISTELSDKKTN